jgi:hypothetical protein
MPQLHRGARLDQEPASSGFILDESLLQNFDRDWTVHLEVTRSIDRTHSARPEAFFNGIFVVEHAAYERIFYFEHVLFNDETDHVHSDVDMK